MSIDGYIDGKTVKTQMQNKTFNSLHKSIQGLLKQKINLQISWVTIYVCHKMNIYFIEAMYISEHIMLQISSISQSYDKRIANEIRTIIAT